MKRCTHQRKNTRPCGGQMFLESVTVLHQGRWSRKAINVDGETVITIEPPPVLRGAMWVCLQCGHEEAGA